MIWTEPTAKGFVYVPFFWHFKPYKRFMIMMSPVPQNGDVSSAADVHHIKLRIFSCELFLVLMS